ncbi:MULTISPECIES: heptaprenyl diphosphate synthase component 1 [unclassified Bacillus (in: firmicutes)]|uniref:heptaprenyl diphosphate synthase component 1 n=1 Tax=unclassified Bacillus (in: firmicutes) TaxID=185979 RepID=UPI0008EB108A|nr:MULTISPECIES: heptaprenyl diphosphate synthase component 1 [unclassified Bacillus (in: firmicutes)]SFA98474.1 heptaprenyl diphosphate synthase [Bacillus sp. UNCCL13]SFQ81070.1 heptaprenyl diphosphate synthase [Bacillus sp. cl95]
MRVQDIRNKIAEMKEQVEQKVLHPYLLKYIQAPVIDEDKLLLLISVLDKLELSYPKLKNYVITTMLIQIALDTHEYVSNGPLTASNGAEDGLKARQLNVLAGDYYSGLYYKLLADMDEIMVIRALAEGIKDVNEQKISVYQKDMEDIEKLIAGMKIIEGALLIRLTDLLKVSNWNDIILNFLLVKRLLSEKGLFISGRHSMFFNALKKILFPKNEATQKELSKEQQNYLLLICDRYIDFSIGLVTERLNHFEDGNEILENQILSVFNGHHSIAKTLVEEG